MADTYLNASGRFIISGLFDVNFGNTQATLTDALLNVLVLLSTASLALFAMGLLLTHRERRA